MSSFETPKLVIFDCDGVLVDSEELANSVLVGALASQGLKLSPDEAIKSFSGLTPEDTVAKAEGMLGRALPENFWEAMQSRTFDAFEQGLKPIDGAFELVTFLKKKGIKICVASSGDHKKMDLTLKLTGLDRLFGRNVFSAEDVTRGKPAPDLFLFAARQMGIEPEQCLVIEDSWPGIEAAQAAGMGAILFDPGGRHRFKFDGGLSLTTLDQVRGIIQ